jgi:F0F1-type ATP synthase membrane subunit c/vacuolar-type H+-ATPase subunit K
MMKRLVSVFTILLCGLVLKPNLVEAQSLTSFSFSGVSGGSAKMAGVPFPVTITALNEFGQTLTSFNQSVTITDNTGTAYPSQTTAFIQGVWQGSVYITQSGTTVLTAAYSSVSANSGAFTVDPDSRIKFMTIVSGNNQTGTVRTALLQALTIKVIDPYNNPIPNVGVNFTLSSLPLGSTQHIFSNLTATTNVSGNASTNFTFGTKTGTYIVTSTLTSGITNTSHFYLTAGSGTLLSIAISPGVAVVPAGSFTLFSATGFDQYANPVPLASVNWSIENGGGTVDQTGAFVAGSTLGTYMNTVRARSGIIGSSATVTVVGAAGESGGTATGAAEITGIPVPTPTAMIAPGSLFNVSIDPAVIAALRNASIPISAQAYDMFGSQAPGVTYDFQVEGDLGTLARTGPSTALLTVGDSGTGTVTVTARQGDITRIARIVGSVGNGLNRRLVIEEVSSPQTVGVPFTISIAAKDTDNNFVTDYLGPLVIADTTGTLDPAVIQPSDTGIWYIQGIISLAHPEVSISAAGDGMVGVSNIFEVVGDPQFSALKPGMGSLGTGFGEILGASISALIDQLMLDKDLNKYTVFRYIGAGIAAGFGILGASIGGGIMASRGLEAIGRNPYAKTRLQVNLYASIVGFIIAAAMAVVATFLIIR